MGRLAACLLWGLVFLLPAYATASPLPVLPPGQRAAHHPTAPAQSEFRKGIAAVVKGDLRAADAAFQHAATLDPKFVDPLLGLADVALRRDHKTDAERWLRRASAVDPHAQPVLIGWARYYRATQQYPAAERVLKQAIAIQPTVSAYLELGDLDIADLDDKAQALTAFERAVALAPKSVPAHRALAIGLATNGQTARAMQELQR